MAAGAMATVLGPVVLLLIGISTNSPAIGAFAGTIAASLTDPVVLIGVAIGAGAGAYGKWLFAFIGGLAASALHSFSGYSWWYKVAGSVIANQMVGKAVILDTLLAMYAYLLVWTISCAIKRHSEINR